MGIFFRSEHTRATAIVAIALTFCATISRAAEPDTQYVIVTALGPGLTIIQKRSGTGTHAFGVSRQTFAFVDATFDVAIQDAAERIVLEAQGGTGPAVVRARVSGMLVDQRAYDLDAAALTSVIDAVRGNIAEPRHARLIVVAPVKEAILLPGELRGGVTTHVGEGAAEGLGFYLDRQMMVRDEQHRENHYGFTAAFANLQLLLVDFDKRSVIARETSTEAEPMTVSWEALTSAQKLAILVTLLKAKVQLHLPVLLRADNNNSKTPPIN